MIWETHSDDPLKGQEHGWGNRFWEIIVMGACLNLHLEHVFEHYRYKQVRTYSWKPTSQIIRITIVAETIFGNAR